jgi:hypothetical protein
MKQVRFFHKDTGIFLAREFFTSNDAAVASNTPADHVTFERKIDHLSQCMDVATGKLVDYQPPSPSADHEWNTTTKRWQINAAVTAKAEAHRSALASIAALEASGVRAVRELALGQAGALDRLKALDIEIAAQRLKL